MADAGWGDGGRCFIALGEGGRVLGLCLDNVGEGALFGAGLGAGEGERLRPRVEDGEAGRCRPGDVSGLSFVEESRAPSADTEVVMPLFCRSVLRLRTGPRCGCRGLAEAERGHR